MKFTTEHPYQPHTDDNVRDILSRKMPTLLTKMSFIFKVMVKRFFPYTRPQ